MSTLKTTVEELLEAGYTTEEIRNTLEEIIEMNKNSYKGSKITE